jgi:O-antigen/teichoic acid export membrane protein
MHITDGVINLILSLILVQYYGILGVALGTAIPGIISRGIVVPIIAAKVLELRLLDYYLFLFKSVAGIIIALVLPFLITKYFIAPTYISIFIVGAMSALVYFPIAFLFVFNRKECNQVLEIITSGLHIARPSVRSIA